MGKKKSRGEASAKIDKETVEEVQEEDKETELIQSLIPTEREEERRRKFGSSLAVVAGL
jgi:hypothetical protein